MLYLYHLPPKYGLKKIFEIQIPARFQFYLHLKKDSIVFDKREQDYLSILLHIKHLAERVRNSFYCQQLLT